MEPFLGEIRIFSFSFAPVGWAFCDGQLLPISQNTALFSLLGINFGGDGRSTFGLPNLQSRVPIDFGQGAGLSDHPLGELGGEPSVTLLLSEVPGHPHAFQASPQRADATTPNAQSSLARSDPGYIYKQPGGSPALGALAAGAVGPSPGGGQPHDNMMPYLTLNFCIALNGIYPPRS